MGVDSQAGSRMLVDAAKRLRPLDPEAAREANLAALSTCVFFGRLGDPDQLGQVAQAAKAAGSGQEPHGVTALLLEGLATWCIDGQDSALPLLRRGIDACSQEPDPRAHLAEWVVFVPTLPPEIWDDDVWDRLTAHLLTASRGAGGLLTLPMALDYRASFEVHSGRLAVASALLDEADAINDATRSTPCLTTLELAAWQGKENEALEQIGAALEFWTARREGRWISLCEYTRAVLLNGLAKYDEAMVAARSAWSTTTSDSSAGPSPSSSRRAPDRGSSGSPPMRCGGWRNVLSRRAPTGHSVWRHADERCSRRGAPPTPFSARRSTASGARTSDWSWLAAICSTGSGSGETGVAPRPESICAQPTSTSITRAPTRSRREPLTS